MPPVPDPSQTPFLVELSGGGGDGGLGVAIIAGIFAVGGVIVGWFGNWLQEWNKGRRETKNRYLDRQLEYASIMIDKAEEVRKLIGTVGWVPMAAAKPDLARKMLDANTNIKEASEQAREAYGKISLVAPVEIRQPALNLRGALLYARTINDGISAKDASAKLTKATRDFEDACRKQFGAD